MNYSFDLFKQHLKHSFFKILHLAILVIICLGCQHYARGAIRPANDARLNYTQIMFEYDEVLGSDSYVISIFETGRKIEIQGPITIKNKSLACIVSGLRFGKSYSWYYEAVNNNKVIFKSEAFRFSILSSYLVDTTLFRSSLDIPLSTAPGTDIFFLDYRGIAIDRQGLPMWYYPFYSTETETDPNFRSLQMTKNGTITFLSDSNCYEVDIDGSQRWKAPNDGKISGQEKEFYHHDFKKLDDGTYLTCSYYYEKTPNFYNNFVTTQVRYNTLIQYDKEGKVLWHWNEKDHISKEIIFGVYNSSDTEIVGTHLNAIDYDAKEDAIIMGCRNNSSIIKIDKKTGNVIYILGVYDNKKKLEGTTPLFLHQHGMDILPDHRLLIFNNNVSEDAGRQISYPQILILKEPEKGKDATRIWEYECRSPRYPNGIIGKGGYATLLPNGNILVCMSAANYIFEITPGKEVVWQCSFQKFTHTNNTWFDFINYRSNYASSLYPYYFTLQHANQKKSSLTININNEGTENDQYEVDIKLQGGRFISIRNIAVKSRNSKTLHLHLKNRYAKKGVTVFVRALSNKSVSKYLVIPENNASKPNQ